MSVGAIAATIPVAANEVAISANGSCSLREAIINANDDAATHADCAAGSGADIITLPAGTYTANQGAANEDFSVTGDLDIRSDITINGAGDFSVTGDLDKRSDITINGAGVATTIIQASTTVGTATDRVLHVVSGTAVLNDVTIQNGKSPNGANGQDCFDQSSCDDNSASDGSPGEAGGGILNGATLTLNRVTVTNNQSGNGGNAGNISCSGDGEFCITNGGAGGFGGGVSTTGTLTVSSSTFTNNQTGNGGAAGSTIGCSGDADCFSGPGEAGGGGGSFDGIVNITDTTFSGNTGLDGGAIQQGGALAVTDSIFTGNSSTNSGGAIRCDSSSAACTISGSTFSGNNVTGGFGGGALFFFGAGVKTVTNSTISGNTSNFDGGGIHAINGTVNLNFVTIAGNTADNDNNGSGNGGGIRRVNATVNLKNSIIAYNIDRGGQANDISGTITSQGYNHIENTTGGTFTPTTGDQINTDPILGPLKDNGGPTLTHAPLSNSPVIDKGQDSGAIGQDQRGSVRPVTYDASIVIPAGGDRSDIGAVELVEGVIPVSADSLKTHGAAGPFPIDLPLTGDPGIECRSGGASNTYQVILKFAEAFTFTSVDLISGAGSVDTSSGNGTSEITLNLTGVTNAQTITIALFADSGDIGLRMGILVGDTTNTRDVNSSDVSETKSKSGQAATADNFRTDVTVNGVINASDISLVKSKSGTGLP